MADLFQCTRCGSPFVAHDEALILRRQGRCARCTEREFLARIGLPPDFLDGYHGPQA